MMLISQRLNSLKPYFQPDAFRGTERLMDALRSVVPQTTLFAASSRALENPTFLNVSYVLSEALSFAPFLKLSRKNTILVSLAQAALQSLICGYSAIEIGKKARSDKRKIIPFIAQLILVGLHLDRAYGSWQDLQKLQKMVGQIFIVMRHADRQKLGDESQILPEGIVRSREAAAIIDGLKQKYEKQEVCLLASDLIRSEQTATVIAESLGISKPEIDARIKERVNNSPLPRKERHQLPQYLEHKAMSSEDKFYRRSYPECESGNEQFQRMSQAIYKFLERTDSRQLPVAVSHSSVTVATMKGLQKTGHDIPETFIKGLKYCEILVLKVLENGMFKGLERIKIDLPPNN
jgi:broad specificity phosphatase PhoE